MREGIGGFSVLGTNTPDTLIAGTAIPVLTEGVLLKPGQGILERGSVIGIITASGKGLLCDAESEDGSQTAMYILAENSIDTTSADVLATCYKTGPFRKSALKFGANGAPDSLANDLRDVGIYLLDSLEI